MEDDEQSRIIPLEPRLAAERERQARFRKEIEDNRKRLDLHTPLFARYFASERIELIADDEADNV